MTTKSMIQANRKNATNSTGPKTEAGKSAVASNPIKHGIHANVPVLTDESLTEWETHQSGIFASLRPEGTLETRLVERIASILWRLNRVIRFETGILQNAVIQSEIPTTDSPRVNPFPHLEVEQMTLKKVIEDYEEQKGWLVETQDALTIVQNLTKWKDDKRISPDAAFRIFEAAYLNLVDQDEVPWVEDQTFLHFFDMPPEDDFNQANWLVKHVRIGLTYYANRGKTPLDKLTARTIASLEECEQTRSATVTELHSVIDILNQKELVKQQRLRVSLILPDATAEGRVIRYESHLNRQLMQTLHELERIQANRKGQNVPVPLAVDVSVDGSPEEVET